MYEVDKQVNTEHSFLALNPWKADKYLQQIRADSSAGIVYSAEAKVKYTTDVLFIFWVMHHY